MKKWNAPKFLNLNVQETKTEIEEYKHHGGTGNMPDHICAQTGQTCATTHLDGFDACAAGHEVTEWDERYSETGCIATCCKALVVNPPAGS